MKSACVNSWNKTDKRENVHVYLFKGEKRMAGKWGVTGTFISAPKKNENMYFMRSVRQADSITYLFWGLEQMV